MPAARGKTLALAGIGYAILALAEQVMMLRSAPSMQYAPRDGD